MMTTHRAQLAELLKALLPAHLHRNAVVAGGYAANPSKAGDIDLWILDSGKFDEDHWVLADDLKDHFGSTDFDVEWNEGSAFYPEAPAAMPTARHPFYRVANITIELPPQSPQFGWMQVQLLTTPLKTVDALLEYFDISIHKYAWRLDAPDELLAAEDTTWPRDVIRVTRFDTPHTTFARLNKLAVRYGAAVNIEDGHKLQRALLTSMFSTPSGEFSFPRKVA